MSKKKSTRKPAQKKNETKETIITVVGAFLVLAVLIGLVVLAVSLGKDGPSANAGSNGVTQGQSQQPDAPTLDDAEIGKPTHIATLVIKDYGTITMELYGNLAPITVQNFVSLAERGFYDGLTFHRIIEGFMMQGGMPKGDDKPASIKGEFDSNGIPNPLAHTRGVVSMARANDPDSGSCQFFIMQEDKPHLDGDYAAFGFVTSGIEVVDAICSTAQPIDGNGGIAKADQPIIEKVTVTAISE